MQKYHVRQARLLVVGIYLMEMINLVDFYGSKIDLGFQF